MLCSLINFNTAFIRLNAAALIKYFVIRVRRMLMSGVYLRSHSFLAAERLNFFRTERCLSVCLFFIVVFVFSYSSEF